MEVKLTKKGRKVARELEIPEAAKDAWNLVMNEEKIKSNEVQELKAKAIVLLEGNKFHFVIKQIEAILKIVEQDDSRKEE